MRGPHVILLAFFFFFIFSGPVLTSQVSSSVQNSKTTQPASFVALGDWGCSQVSRQISQMIEEMDADVILGLGDYAFDNNTSCFFDMVEPFADKMKIAFGKHDVSSESIFDEYMDYFGLQSQYYSYDFANIHFTVISTEVPFKLGYPQYDFVMNDLERASNDNNIDWLIVYYHRPAYTSTAYDVKKAEAIRDTYHPLFDTYGVDLVLQAHNQFYQRTFPLIYNPFNSSSPLISDSHDYHYDNPKGPIFLTVGTGGGDLHYPKFTKDYVERTLIGRGCVKVEISNGGKELTGEFYSLDHKVVDKFTITKS